VIDDGPETRDQPGERASGGEGSGDGQRRLRDELTAHLNAAELSWYPRSRTGRDIHRGVLSGEGMVSAVCGVQFRPQGTAGCPPDPERVCLACCRVMPG